MSTTIINPLRRKFLSELVASTDTFGDNNMVDFHRETVQLTGTATDVDPIGTPIVWDGTSRFVVYTAEGQITTAKAADNTPLKGGAVVAVLVGDKFSYGFNKADLDLTTDPYATALFNGEYVLKEAGMEWGGIAAAEQEAFKLELATKRISFIEAAEQIEPSKLNA